MNILERLTTALADRYRVEREIGAGGMATVYLAHDLRHDRDVAIKVLHPDLGAALGGERFLSEIRTTARLQHPHILPLLDSGEADTLLYYVMPLVTGETLRARIVRERQLPIATAIQIAREVAGALEHAHKQGIIHRDVKPENILLQDGSALVADFGIALAVRSAGGQRLTQTGLSLGTPQYMSPEQAMGERVVDARSDVYALAAITYEMLTGDPPFTGSSVQAVVAKVMSAEPERLTLTRKTIPLAIERAVLTGLAKLPADRQESAAAFGAAMRDASPDTQSDTTQPSASPRSAARTANRGSPWKVGVVGVAAGMAIMAAALWPRGSTRNGINAVGFTRAQMTFTGKGALPAITPDGDVMAYVESDCEQQGYDAYRIVRYGHASVPCVQSLMVQDTGSSTPVRVMSRVPSIRAVRWLASATSLVIDATLDSLRNGIFLVPRLGGATRRVAEQGAFDVHASGDTILVLPLASANAMHAQMIIAATGAVVDSVSVPRRAYVGIAWSPNGERIALMNESSILLIARDGTVLDSLPLRMRRTLHWAPDGSALFAFLPAPARDDEFVRIDVDKAGHLARLPVAVMPRVPTLYRGEFDIAARTGRLLFISGDARQDQWVFDIGAGTTSPRAVTTGTSWYGNAAIAPDGKTLFYVRGNSAGDNLYRLALNEAANSVSDDEALTNSSGPGYELVSISQDGRRVTFTKSEGDTAFAYDFHTGERRVLRRSPEPTGQEARLPRANGAIVTVGVAGHDIALTDGISGASKLLSIADSLQLLRGGTLSPDEQELAVTTRTPTGFVLGAVSLATGRFRSLTPIAAALQSSKLSWARDGSIYFGAWEAGARAPSLLRVNATTGGAPQRVMTLPSHCAILSISVATAAPRGVCMAEDYRGDLYLATIPGVMR